MLIALVAFSGLAFGDEANCQHANDAFYCVKYLHNYDADTVTFELPGVHPLLGHSISVRVLGVDAPEIKGKTDCEKAVALQAKKEVTAMLATARKISLVSIARDKYFRIVADVIADGQSLSRYLLARRLAYPYMGGTKEKIDWCTFPKG